MALARFKSLPVVWSSLSILQTTHALCVPLAHIAPAAGNLPSENFLDISPDPGYLGGTYYQFAYPPSEDKFEALWIADGFWYLISPPTQKVVETRQTPAMTQAT